MGANTDSEISLKNASPPFGILYQNGPVQTQFPFQFFILLWGRSFITEESAYRIPGDRPNKYENDKGHDQKNEHATGKALEDKYRQL